MTSRFGTTQTISHMQQPRQLFEGTTAVELNAVDFLFMTQTARVTAAPQRHGYCCQRSKFCQSGPPIGWEGKGLANDKRIGDDAQA